VDALPGDGGVLRQDGDAALALEGEGVHPTGHTRQAKNISE
jgi:hypothetical protein